jgi:hypothetical protein
MSVADLKSNPNILVRFMWADLKSNPNIAYRDFTSNLITPVLRPQSARTTRPEHKGPRVAITSPPSDRCGPWGDHCVPAAPPPSPPGVTIASSVPAALPLPCSFPARLLSCKAMRQWRPGAGVRGGGPLDLGGPRRRKMRYRFHLRPARGRFPWRARHPSVPHDTEGCRAEGLTMLYSSVPHDGPVGRLDGPRTWMGHAASDDAVFHASALGWATHVPMHVPLTCILLFGV